MDDANRAGPLPSALRQLPWQTDVAVPLPADAGFTAWEHWAWARIIHGARADMRFFPVDDPVKQQGGMLGPDDGAGEDPGDAKNWPPHRVLSARFMRTILFYEPWVGARALPFVRIRCAQFKDQLDWCYENIAAETAMLCCRFEQSVAWIGMRVMVLNLGGSHFEEGFNADGLIVQGDLFCRRGFEAMGDVRMVGAHIGGDLSFAKATLHGALTAGGLIVDGHLFCHDQFKAEKDVFLVGARIRGQAAFVNAALHGFLHADGIEIGGDCFLRSASHLASANLMGARISQDLQLSGSVIEGTINLTGADIRGELSFAQQAGSEPLWGNEARLILRNAKAGALAGGIDAFRRKGRRRGFVSCDLAGFSYERLGGLGAGAQGSTLASARNSELRAWLKQCRPIDHFDPASYKTLAKALQDAGRSDRAADVRNALGNYQIVARGTPLLQRFMLCLSWLFIGFGERNHRALIAFACLVLIAAAVGYWQDVIWMPQGLPSGWSDMQAWRDWTGFSFGDAVPLLSFDEAHKTFLIDRFCGERVANTCQFTVPTGLTAFYYTVKLVGFVILSYLAAGLTGLAQRRE